MKARRWVLILLASAVFVALRLKFNREYDGAPWEALVDGTARRPFGHRVLVPWMVRPFVEAGISIRTAFACVEWVAAIAVFTGVDAALRSWVPRRAALLGAAGAFGVLGLAFLLPFRWPIFYPWDTPAIACIAWGLALAQSRRHGVLVLLATVGAANRESAILLPFITVALFAGSDHLRQALRSASLQLVCVVMMRTVIAVADPIPKGAVAHLRVEGMWRLDHNLQWLADPMHVLVILGAFSALPVLWAALRSQIPPALRRLELVWMSAMAGLLVVANIYEPRAWGEPLVLLYLGVAVGVTRWIRDEPEEPEGSFPPDRWSSPALALTLVAAVVLWKIW